MMQDINKNVAAYFEAWDIVRDTQLIDIPNIPDKRHIQRLADSFGMLSSGMYKSFHLGWQDARRAAFGLEPSGN